MARKKHYEEYAKPFLEDIIKWKRSGLTDEQINHKLNIGKTLACKWKNEYKEFENAFKNGKEELLIELKNSLYNRAQGYFVEDTDTYITEKNGAIEKKIHKKKRFIWSDKCMEMALNHLQPNKWDNRQTSIDEEDDNIIEIVSAGVHDED